MKPIFLLIFFTIAMQAQNIIPEKNILDALDRSNEGRYNTFIELADKFSYLVDCRINIFRSEKGEWAIVAELLGYNPSAGYVELEISYFGNCLINLKEESNSYTFSPITNIDHEATGYITALDQDIKSWFVRGQKVLLSHDKKIYKKAGIELNEYEPDEIQIQEAARLAVINHRNLFRATDAELYKCIPANLKKIMILDEWYHRDYYQPAIIPTEDQLKVAYEENKASMQEHGMSLEDLLKLMAKKNETSKKFNEDNYNNNRPSSYETWQLIVKVISQNNSALYKPTIKPNTHWKNWPDSGSL